jgi:hypothetical protein
MQDVRTLDVQNAEVTTATVRGAGSLNVELALEAGLGAEDARGDGPSEPNAHAASADAKKNAGKEQLAPRSRSDSDRPRRWPGLVSIAAVIFSGVSLYETVLKHAELSVYVGELGHVSWDKTGAEIIALPVTVANHGARDAVVYGLRLGPDDEPDRYRSIFVGVPSAGRNEPFAPWPVAGHGSRSGVAQFQATGDARPLITPTVSAAAKSYRLCLTIHAEASRSFGLLDQLLERPPAALRLVVEPAHRFGISDVTDGNLIPLRITGIERIDDCRRR